MKIYVLNLNLLWQCRIQMMLLTLLLIPCGNATAALEFLSIAENAVIMYNAPSLKADKLYIASRHLPVESVVKVEGWNKVRDSSGALAWVEQRTLSDKRFLIVTAIKADIYQTADVNSVLTFQAQQNVVLEWLESTTNGWIKVRHQDGQNGYVRILQVWGS